MKLIDIYSMKSIFKKRVKKLKLFGDIYKSIEFQCPICKEWFSWSKDCYFYDVSVKHHITMKKDREIKLRLVNKPHYDYFKKHTKTKVEWLI